MDVLKDTSLRSSLVTISYSIDVVLILIHTVQYSSRKVPVNYLSQEQISRGTENWTMSGSSADSKPNIGLANSLSNIFKLVSYNFFLNYVVSWVGNSKRSVFDYFNIFVVFRKILMRSMIIVLWNNGHMKWTAFSWSTVTSSWTKHYVYTGRAQNNNTDFDHFVHFNLSVSLSPGALCVWLCISVHKYITVPVY